MAEALLVTVVGLLGGTGRVVQFSVSEIAVDNNYPRGVFSYLRPDAISFFMRLINS